MKTSVGLGLLLAFVLGCQTPKNEQTISSAMAIERQGIVYRIHAAEPFTGIITNQYRNGQMKSMTCYRQGLKDGLQIERRENGTPREKMTWCNGLRHGEQTQWYEDGRLLFQGWMENDKWVGTCQGWYPDGRRAFSITFKDGRGLGRKVVIEWNDRNLIREFPDVLIDGEWIEWQRSGRITRQEIYRDGKLIEKIH